MGILKLFSKATAGVAKLPTGSLTIDRDANLVASTISSEFSPEYLTEIGELVLRVFREAREAQMPLTELNLHFASLQITAREMRGGAVVFVKPKNAFNGSLQN